MTERLDYAQQADEAWRQSLRSVSLSDLAEALLVDTPHRYQEGRSGMDG